MYLQNFSNSAFYRASAVLAVPPIFVLISQTSAKVLPTHAWRYGAPTKNPLFRLQLEKCYSYRLMLHGSHHPMLAVSDFLYYFSFLKRFYKYSVVKECITLHPVMHQSLLHRYEPLLHFQHRKQRFFRRRYVLCKVLSWQFQSHCEPEPCLLQYQSVP